MPRSSPQAGLYTLRIVAGGFAGEVTLSPWLLGFSMFVFLALYISLKDVQAPYPHPEFLWFICPLVLYWVLRMVIKVHRGEMTDDPILVAATNRGSLVTIALCGLIAIAAAFGRFSGG